METLSHRAYRAVCVHAPRSGWYQPRQQLLASHSLVSPPPLSSQPYPKMKTRGNNNNNSNGNDEISFAFEFEFERVVFPRQTTSVAVDECSICGVRSWFFSTHTVRDIETESGSQAYRKTGWHRDWETRQSWTGEDFHWKKQIDRHSDIYGL